MKRRAKAADPTTHYARAVVAGKVVAGRPVRLACARHLRDLERWAELGLRWRVDLAARALAFFDRVLTLEDGRPFVLQPWQQFIVGSLFGWLSIDGTRRFRSAYIESGKGSGKSPLAAGIGLFGLVADGEPSAEIYSAATMSDQAKVVWRDARGMVERSPELAALVKIEAGTLSLQNSPASVFRAVSAEHRGLDGRRVHIALVDELHEHPSAMVTDKLRAGTKGRRNALLFEISNAGWDRHSVCWQHHSYSLQVLEGTAPNESWFAYVCSLDEGDSWTDESCWSKVNPNIGISIPLRYLREQVAEAVGMPSKESIVRRLNFCEWLEGSAARAIPLDEWDRGAEAIDVKALHRRPCFGGLDLARVSDLSAFVLLFPPVAAEERWKVLPFFWCPEEDIRQRAQRDRVPYDVWVRQGLITATPGNVTDFGFIEAKIVELAGLYQIREVAFDRTFAGEIVQDLQAEGLTMVQFGQGFLSMAAPMAELLRLVRGGEIQHGGNPVLRWMAGNLAVAIDAAGNMKPDKERSAERIDGISALCNALGRAAVAAPPKRVTSVYDERAERGEKDVLRWL